MTRQLSGLALLTLLVVGQTAWADRPIEPDVVYGHKDGLAMTMDVLRPDESNGAGIVAMVSGGWRSQKMPTGRFAFLFEPLLNQGYTIFAVRHGSSPRYGIPDAVADVRRSIRFIRHHQRRFEVDPERIGVVGMSSGGHLALMLGTTGDGGRAGVPDPVERASSRVRAVVAFVPPTDLRVAVWEAPESLPAYRQFPALDLDMKRAAEYSPLLHASADDASILMIAGGKDELVPSFHATRLHEALKQAEADSKLIVIEEAGHGFAGEQLEQALDAMLDWYQHKLK